MPANDLPVNSVSAQLSPTYDAVWQSQTVEQTVAALQTDLESGLSAQQVSDRQIKFGSNELEEKAGRGTWEIMIDQFKNIMLILLIAVAFISAALDLMNLLNGQVKPNDIPFKDTIAILAIVILNGVLGYLQESRAEKALAALKQLTSPRVRVTRAGKITEIDSKELVPGDVIQLEAGVQVAADGRLIEAANLQVRESALTGEAQAANKQPHKILTGDTALGDQVNLVFQGTEVVQGRGTVVVTNTGMQTELGKIATMLQDVENDPTPLQKRMDQLSQTLVTGSMTLVVIVVVGGIIFAGLDKWQQLVEVSLSMAVAVVPEGLPAVITVTLAIGTQRMVRRNALIRKLPAVETLGSVTNICSDKTGTLTQNKMVVQSLHTASSAVQISGEGYIPQGDFVVGGQPVNPQDYPEARALLLGCAMCNDSILQQDGQHWQILGDPTEGALVVAAAKANIERDQWKSKLPRVGEFPFTSERKRMSVIVQDVNGALRLESALPDVPYMMFMKGSPELVLERCSEIQQAHNAKPLTNAQRETILASNNELAGKGLRVLGFAYKPLQDVPPQDTEDSAEQGLVWLGLIDMLDAPRPEVKDAVVRCQSAGIRTMMITGDHQLTAQAIAQDLGIARAGEPVLVGRDLEKMDAQELEQQVQNVNVYARVAPEHKLRIVQALQNQDRIVAMTGDGVNDAPALKQANIGVAMGITGTDVSKEASDMVLLDDNFATIVAATEEGRVVYTNIRRFIKYILGSNIGEVLTIAATPLVLNGVFDVPLTPLQILWMNLVTDGLPALALAVEPAEPNVMDRAPNNPKESIFARGLGIYMVRIGIVLAILSVTLMWWSHGYTHANLTAADPNGDRWKTMVFTTLCLAQMGHAIAIRSNSQLTLTLNPLTNPYVWGSVILTSVLQLMLVYVEPLRNFFGTHYLNGTELAVCIGFSLLMFVWIEGEKLFTRKAQPAPRLAANDDWS
ncbi:cation-transporting P-type ATPase [filamentous cyanobacterium LEGE 11480]|uniref:Cation-transporting P-type ATPase n=1 Tax=Romeriopsis navalis LEGE 11480 TaxID=2777977 RepID=A0A928Z2J9_9CYAN|nr:cation-transporting P-type ATPase [Romeriopsis navalis]MBE9028203.1 cation-transporting P-type ATPase [Romeriopsis navalis LEGE 11480]